MHHAHVASGLGLEVLTRREQLLLAAKSKENKQKGRGRGRGRGRGKANRATSNAPEHEAELDNGEDQGLEEKASASTKRPIASPTRRKLCFDSDNANTPAKEMHMEISPAKSEKDKESPPVKQKKKRTKRATKNDAKKVEVNKEDDGAAASSQPDKQPQPPAQPEQERKAKTIPRIPPTQSQQTWAEEALKEAKADPSAWFHVKKLFEATEVGERQWARKMMYWGFSMYWEARRVGLLQAKTPGSKKKNHVCSFSAQQLCAHIGIPMAATLLLVGSLFVFQSNGK